jgi:DNA modification methylase
MIELNNIYNKNCLDFLKDIPDKSFDLTLTDPPYGVGSLKGKGGISAQRNKNDYDKFEDTKEHYADIVVKTINECIRVSKRVVLTPGPKNFCLLPQPDDFGCFYQPATCGISTWGRPDSQPIFYYGKCPHSNITQMNSYVLTEKPNCNLHPCSKPIKAWTWLLLHSSLAHETVFDPFMGSGTTAIACIKTGRNYVGCEISKKYFDISMERIRKENEQTTMFDNSKFQTEEFNGKKHNI